MDLTHVSETVYPVASSAAAPGGGHDSTATDLDKTIDEPDPTIATQGITENDPSSPKKGQDGHDCEPGPPPLSKSALKKQAKRQRRQQLYEERKQDRKRLKKEKRHEQTARRQAERATKIAEAEAAGLDPQTVLEIERSARKKRQVVPITIILDCDFEQYMSDKELLSLSSQIVRSYSENRGGLFQAHIMISSWKGKLRERFETVLNNHHVGWKGTHFVEGDFVEAGQQALDLMKGPRGGTLSEVLQPVTASKPLEDGMTVTSSPAAKPDPDTDATPIPEPQTGDPSLVYLTSDSPYTLDRLEPYTSYVIGGIVDRNREKGLCYKRACQRNVRTAKLPIGDYMVMSSRKVLTTNQVVEIMGKWLETGDWRAAFEHVIPKRKGGVMRGENETSGHSNDQNDAGEEGDEGAAQAQEEEEDDGDGGVADLAMGEEVES